MQKAADLARWKREWLLWAAGSALLVVIWAVIYAVRGRLVLWSLPASVIVVWFLLVALAPLVPTRRRPAGEDGA